MRLEFSILSNKNAPAAPHIPSAVSAHRRWDAPSRQDRSRAALRLERQPSARPREDGAGCRRRQHSAGASWSHSGLTGGTSGCSGHHWRCCSAPKSEIFIYVSPEEVYSKWARIPALSEIWLQNNEEQFQKTQLSPPTFAPHVCSFARRIFHHKKKLRNQ